MRNKEEILKRYNEEVEALKAYANNNSYDYKEDESYFSYYILHALTFQPITEEDIRKEIRTLELEADGCHNVCLETYRWALNE